MTARGHGRLPALFCYYGAKWRAARLYPRPRHDVIIEPFAGSAGFSLLNHRADVRLFDVDEAVVGVWRYLLRVSSREILALPDIIDEIPQDLPQEARWLIGFWLNKGCERPRLTPSSWMRSGRYPGSFWGERVRLRIAGSLPFIRHWRVEQRSYETIDDVEACWFIDPPYQGAAGRHYKHSEVDYQVLAAWVRARRGQVIACDADGADWLPFKPLASVKGLRAHTHEVVWTNDGAAASEAA